MPGDGHESQTVTSQWHDHAGGQVTGVTVTSHCHSDRDAGESRVRAERGTAAPTPGPPGGPARSHEFRVAGGPWHPA